MIYDSSSGEKELETESQEMEPALAYGLPNAKAVGKCLYLPYLGLRPCGSAPLNTDAFCRLAQAPIPGLLSFNR